MKLLLPTCLLLISCFSGLGRQAPAADTLKGKVMQRKKNAAIPFASISLSKTGRQMLTDADGTFQIIFPAADSTLVNITAAGFSPLSVWVRLSDTVQLFYADERITQLDEVIVTGVGTGTRIKSTPVAVSVVTSKELMQHPNSNAIDALSRSVPGLQTVTTGPNVSKPSIRGLGYNRVLTLFDGIRQEGQQWADEHGIEADQYNIGRAEMVKGPASLAYGSDAVAGVINLIPFVPTVETPLIKGDALLEYFTNNNMMAGSLGLHRFKNHFFWAGRASVKAAKDYRNQLDGRVFNTGFREWNGSVLAGWKKTSWQSYVAFTVYNNLQEIPDGSRDSVTRKFTRQVADGPADDILTRPIVPGAQLNSYGIDPLHQYIRHYRLYNKSSFTWGNNEVNTAVSFTRNSRQEFTHPTALQQAGLYVVLNTYQLSATWNKNLAKDWLLTTGVNSMYQTNRSKDATDFPIPDDDMWDAGLFAMVKKEWSKISVSGGIRYDNRNIRWNDFYTATNPATGFDYHVTNSRDTAAANLAFSRYRNNFSGITSSLGFTYTVSSSFFIKANVARGYRSPNITEMGANGLDPGAHIYYIGNRNFKPEFNWQQDIGFFIHAGGLEGGIELFNNQISNYIFLEKLMDANGQPVELVPGNSTYGYQQGSARLYGFDVSLKYRPRAAAWLKLGGTASSVTGVHTDETLLRLHGPAARYLPLISPLRILTDASINLPDIGPTLRAPYLRLEMDRYAAQNKFYAVQNTETATTAYTLVNAAVGFKIEGKKGDNCINFSLQADNIFNMNYQSHLNRLKYFEYYASSPKGRTGIYNMGRNICLRTVFSF